MNDGIMYLRECKCVNAKKSRIAIAKSGLADVLDALTFNSFTVSEKWQEDAKKASQQFSAEKGRWLFIGGQNGSGKTHLCTAAAGELLKKGVPVKYMLWKDESTRLKACVNDDRYETMVSEYKTVKALYIDDFWKIVKDRDGQPTRPTEADINLAFEILNDRYIGKLTTIISSERKLDEITDIDQAIGSRIYQMAGAEYRINIGRSVDRNYRMR